MNKCSIFSKTAKSRRRKKGQIKIDDVMVEGRDSVSKNKLNS